MIGMNNPRTERPDVQRGKGNAVRAGCLPRASAGRKADMDLGA